MSPDQYAQSEQVAKEYQDCLKEAFAQGDPASDIAQKACDLHRQWLCLFWDSYSKEAHMGVTQMYVDDPRFGEYYNKIAPGCTTFLRDAVAVYCKGDAHDDQIHRPAAGHQCRWQQHNQDGRPESRF
jgi:hypothetical protein